MGTEARIVLYAADEAAARQAAEAAFERIAALEQVMSDWRQTSELSELGRAAGGEPRPLGGDLFEVLRRARSIAEESGGAFDPTVGPVVALWREARRRKTLPGDADLAAALSLVGWRLLELDLGPARLGRLAKSGMLLDLGGIGKGFAAQQAVDLLAARGFRQVLVALAGDVVCGEAPPGRAGWDVALGAGGVTVPLARSAISTSGDVEQFLEIGGVRYSHVVDPRTGIGLVRSAEVTVSALDGATSDALATAVCVLADEEAGRALVAKFPGAKLVRFRN